MLDKILHVQFSFKKMLTLVTILNLCLILVKSNLHHIGDESDCGIIEQVFKLNNVSQNDCTHY